VNVSLPHGIEQIDCGAFEDYTSLASIAIPDIVTYIGHDTFEGCDALCGVVFKGKTCNTISIQSLAGAVTGMKPVICRLIFTIP
jgi:hypothetical protein